MASQATESGREGRLLTVWTPEDKDFWRQQGQAVAVGQVQIQQHGRVLCRMQRGAGLGQAGHSGADRADLYRAAR